MDTRTAAVLVLGDSDPKVDGCAVRVIDAGRVEATRSRVLARPHAPFGVGISRTPTWPLRRMTTSPTAAMVLTRKLELRLSVAAGCWLAATRVLRRNGRDQVFCARRQRVGGEFGMLRWRQYVATDTRQEVWGEELQACDRTASLSTRYFY